MRLRQAAFFGYHRAKGSRLGAVYRRMREEDRARAAAEQVPARLRDLLRHAESNVPFYAEHLAGARGTIDTDPAAVLNRLPLLTKRTIRERFADLHSSDAARRRTHAQSSGGSTGEPVRLTQDGDYQDRVAAVQLLYSTWAGRELGEPEVMIWGSEREVLDGSLSFRARVANGLMRRRYVNAFRISRDEMRECLAELSRDPPKLIVAYVQALDDLASLAEEEGIELAPQRAIISTAGTLEPHMRERIERVFGCRVFDRYGSREVGDIAGECHHRRGLHVFPWTNYVEVLADDADRPAAPGEAGRVVVTSLCNYAMPLIRYEIGDRASLPADGAPACPCGRGGQRLARLFGRTVDTFKAPDGRMVNGEYFTHLLYFRDFITRFQVVQRSPNRLVYRMVTAGPAPEAELEEIVAGTRAALGPECEVEFEFVERIEPSPSGKYRYTISEC